MSQAAGVPGSKLGAPSSTEPRLSGCCVVLGSRQRTNKRSLGRVSHAKLMEEWTRDQQVPLAGKPFRAGE